MDMVTTQLAGWLGGVALAVHGWVESMTWVDVMEFFFVTMSMVGQHYISQRNPRGFGFWIAGNVAALVMFVALGRWMTTLLYVYFLYMCFKGLVTWRKLDANTDADGGSRPKGVAPMAEAG